MAHRVRQVPLDAPTTAEFDADGWVAIPDVLNAEGRKQTLRVISRLVEQAHREPRARDRVTGGTLHLDVLAASPDPQLPQVWVDDRILTLVRHHLGPAPDIGAAAYRAPLAGYGAQTLHVDWPAPIYDERWQVCNALVALVDIDERAGPTRVVPGTHRTPDTRFRAKSPTDRHPRQALLTGPAGSAFVFSGHLLHSGTLNSTDAPRHALLINYRRADPA